MPQLLHDLPPFENVQAGSAGAAIMPRIPQGEIYDTIVLKLGGTFVAADLTYIRVKLGGKLIVDVSGAQLNSINKFYSLTNSATYIPIHFADRNAQTIRGRRIGAIDTRNFAYNEFSMEVYLDGTQSSATLEAFCLKGGQKPTDVAHMFRALVSSTHAPGAAGTFNLDISTGSEVGNLIRALHFSHSNLTHFELLKDALPYAQKRAVADYQFVQAEVLRTAQSGWFTYDAIVDGDQSESLDTRKVNDPSRGGAMQYKATVSGSDTIVSIADLYASIASL